LFLKSSDTAGEVTNTFHAVTRSTRSAAAFSRSSLEFTSVLSTAVAKSAIWPAKAVRTCTIASS
jgi:hypothetical protein